MKFIEYLSNYSLAKLIWHVLLISSVTSNFDNMLDNLGREDTLSSQSFRCHRFVACILVSCHFVAGTVQLQQFRLEDTLSPAMCRGDTSSMDNEDDEQTLVDKNNE